jgi:hypothetical protein
MWRCEMGYRSDVTALVYVPSSYSAPDATQLSDEERTEKYEALKVLLKTTFAHVYEEFGDCAEFHDDNEMLVFKIDNVKWYTDDPTVRDFEAFLDCMQDLSYAYEFGRFGEDYEDIEIRSGGDHNYRLGVSREFHW